MRQLKIGERVLTDKDVFVIAELGANHMGDVELAHEMIVKAARCGVDAVKLQKRDNARMFTKGTLARPYNNELSYGPTYGAHREHLDWFGEKEFRRLQDAAIDRGLYFFATPFEEESALFLNALDVPMFKIASCDVTNLPFLRFVASMQKPMILSTGGHTMDEIDLMTDAMDEINQNYALLHCVSLYPNEDADLQLRNIVAMRAIYKDKLIGFSSHHPGTLPLMIARSLGASIFEVHFTLNRGYKGTDHGFSMEPQGLAKICEDLPRIDVMMGDGLRHVSEQERSGFVSKMGKGIYLAHGMKAGDTIREIDIVIKSPAGDGYKPYQEGEVVGKELLQDCSTGISLKEGMLK
jgi:N-acetylneuraminate synthase/sialic acid synthase